MYRILAIVFGSALTVALAVLVTMQMGVLGVNKPIDPTGVSASGLGSTVAQTTTEPIRSITVSGEGIASAVPDVIKVDVGVEVIDQSLSEARSSAASKMEAVIQKLKDNGVAEKDIQTVNLYINPEMNYDAKPPKITGFRVTNIVRATIRDINKAGDIVDQLIAAGATNVNGLAFTIDDIKPVQAQAREKAMADAKAKAEQLAKLGNVTLGPVISINESGIVTPPVPYAMRDMAAGAAAESAPTTPVQAGEQDVLATVTVVYAIQ